MEDSVQERTLKLKFRWEIPYFNALIKCEQGQSIEKEEFFGSKNFGRCILRIFPNGKLLAPERNVSYSLDITCANHTEFSCNYKMAVLSKAGEKHFEISESSPVMEETEWISHADLYQNEKLVMPDGRLVLQCEALITLKITYYHGFIPDDITNKYEQFIIHEFKDFEKLLSNDEFSDVILKTDDKEIMAHKCILSARSVVFSKMLREAKVLINNKVVLRITDIDSDILVEVMRFIYVAEVHNFKAYVEKLLFAGYRFSLLGLKKKCEIELMKRITVQSACHLLSLSDKCKASVLMDHAMDFIIFHKAEITNTDDYKILSQHKHLFQEIFTKMAKMEQNGIII